MIKNTLFIITIAVSAILLSPNFASSQGYNIQLKINSAQNKEVYLAHYYISNIYIDDTVKLDATGFGKFEGDSLLPQGLYKIYLDKNNHFDFLLGADQQFSIGNKTFAANTIDIKGAVETEEFINYTLFLNNLKKESSKLNKKLKSSTGKEKDKFQNEVKELTPKLHGYWKSINKKYPETFLAKFLMSGYVPELDITTLSQEIQKNDSLLLLARFKYQQKHFWEYFDYTDERFLYTPLLKPKLKKWFTLALYQRYDSIRPHVFEFIENVKPSKRLFQFVAPWFLNSSINSKVLGMDALFIDLAKEYYLSGETFWTSDESMDKIKENVLFYENTLIGKTAPNLTMQSVDGEFFNLHQIEEKYTIVLIYEPNCSHCKVLVPQVYNKIYQKYKEKGLEVFAIYSMDDKDEWVEFLEKEQLWDWINVWDANNETRFKISYDVRKTPRVFVLDENKKIVTKNLSVEQLEHYFKQNLE